MDITNLLDAGLIVAETTTALAAIAAAYFSWKQGRQQVLIEAFETIKVDQAGTPYFTLAVSLSNRRRTSIQPLFLEVRGLAKAEIGCADAPPKDSHQEAAQAAFPDMAIPPYETREATFDLAFDWQAFRPLTTAGRDLRWQAVVTFRGRGRDGRRQSQPLDMVFPGELLHRLASGDSPPVERRRPGRPFSGAADVRRRGVS